MIISTNRKKSKKTFKKVLTKGRVCDIICKLSPRATDKRSLKIEQQEIKYKAKKASTETRQILREEKTLKNSKEQIKLESKILADRKIRYNTNISRV